MRSWCFLLLLTIPLAALVLAAGSMPVLSLGNVTQPARVADDFDAIKVGDRIRVTLRRGGKYEGEVVEKVGQIISVKHRFGTARIDRSDVLEWERFKTISEQFDERAEQCKTAEEWCDLGDWATEQAENSLAEQAWRKATELDPSNKRARDALGEVLHEGKWMPLEEAMRAQGKESYGGEWLTPEQIEARQEEESTAMRKESLKVVIRKQLAPDGVVK